MYTRFYFASLVLMFNLESLSSTDVCYVHVKLTSSYHGLLSVLLVLLYVIAIVIIKQS